MSFLSFGNEMIKDVIAACATDAYAAASLRHDGNKKFSGKEYAAAVEAYTEGKGTIVLPVKCRNHRQLTTGTKFISAA